jgi:copper chaperone CopZ
VTQTATYTVPDISCNHCVHAINGELQTVAGVESVKVDVKAKTVTVVGEPLDDAAIIAAIDDAGYEVVA